jgi:uncharacterized protein (DUF427 family)
MACMAVKLLSHLMRVLPELRYQPTLKHLRVRLGDDLVADTDSAVLIWEPRRIVPTYAVPERDIAATLQPASTTGDQASHPVSLGEGPPVLDPSTGFGAHTAAGEPLDVLTAGGRADGGAFRPADPDLAGYVVLDFAAFDWREEDEPVISHAQDPFHRVDVRASHRHIRLEQRGIVLAESRRPHLLFEAGFPLVRYYLPRDDVLVELRPGTLHTVCAYKGRATHYTAVAGDQEIPDIALSYQDPLLDATPVRGLISFDQERLDVFVDGQVIERPRTPWS